MVYGAILEKGERFYTYLSKVFTAIEGTQTKYNWLITDCVCYPQSPDIAAMLSQEFCWLSGDRLTSIVQKEDFQWIWGVLSGFDPDISREDVLRYPLPYADEYGGFWKNPLSIQHPLASTEIVAWDSGSTMLFSKRKEIVNAFRNYFPLSEDMVLHNERFCDRENLS